MKKFLKTSLLSAFIFSSTVTFASSFSDTYLMPYAWVDAAMRYSPFQRNFGGNVFKSYYPESNIFFGVKFSDYLGTELGYRTSTSKTQGTSLGAGETIFGRPVGNPPEVHTSTANFKG